MLSTRRLDALIVALAVCAAGVLGFANLAAPSLWHDELVHVYVGKSIAEGNTPQLPSGEPYYSGTTWNVLLGGVIRFFGMSEFAVRAPSVIVSMINVALAYVVVATLLGPRSSSATIPLNPPSKGDFNRSRGSSPSGEGPTPGRFSPNANAGSLARPPLKGDLGGWWGRHTALITAVCMALSPWTVAWAREARFYSLQQTFYLLTIYAFFRATRAQSMRSMLVWSATTLAVYALGVLTSFHSILFLSGIGLYAAIMFIGQREQRRRWFVTGAVIGATGLLTIGSYFVLMNSLDREAVFDRGGLGGAIVDPERALRTYYLHWLWTNHSLGVFILALFGFGCMLYRRRPEMVLATLAFWGPILILTYFIGYRQFRFMFFAFPFYLAAVSYGLVELVAWMRRAPKRRIAWIPRVAAAVFLMRAGVSAATLIHDSAEVAGGANTTLARRHPQWRAPCQYVRERMDGAAILTTTYLPVLYYVGRVDNWYPNRFLWWEEDESGLHGLSNRCDLETFMAKHPKGYFLAHRWRFDDGPWIHRFPEWQAEAEWVKRTMVRIDEASTDDVAVYAWDNR